MVSRKRGRAEMESSEPTPEPSLLSRLRSTWEFANLMQYIFIFGRAVKIDEEFDIEDLEAECLKPGPSDKLSEIGLALLKFVSSHRGLTPELFDEYTRRQYVAKAPSRNPFGTEEMPEKFANFDVFTKLRVLFQLSQWTLINADRIRERMPETKDTEQTQWRIEEIGYDRDERLYFVLDDNRLYRRTDPAIPPPPASKPKANSKKGKAAARASKRRKVIDTDESTNGVEDMPDGEGNNREDPKAAEDDGLGGRKWECIAVSLNEYQDFIESIRQSKDADEKYLCNVLVKEVLPVIEKAAENQQKKIAKRERELKNLEKLATAKRSSRIASKQDREREEQAAAEAERKKQADLIAAKKDREKQKQMEDARESRMMTREQRLKEREYKRLLHEEELANLSEDSKKLETGEARMSERHLKAEMEKKRLELERLAQEDQWIFDCSKCGVHGENLADAEKEDFHFICDDCKRREEDSKKPKIPSLKFRLGASSSPPSNKTALTNGIAADGGSRKRKSIDHGDEIGRLPPIKKFRHVALPRSNNATNPDHGPNANQLTDMHKSIMNGPTLSPHGQHPPHTNTGNGQSPPGLAWPPRPPAYTNGHKTHTTMFDRHVAQPHHTFRADGSDSAQDHITRDASSTAPRTSEHGSGFSNLPSQDPFLNSFDRQRPSSSHSTHNLPSPMKNRPSMSPTQGNPDVGALAFPRGTFANGHLPTSRPSATHPSAYNPPTKQLNSSPPAPSTLLPSSSPIMPPPTQQHRASLSGLSPSKHSPPRPVSSHSMSGTPIMPPVTNLEPSPQTLNLSAPMKGIAPEQIKTAGQVNGHDGF
ncbi:MAG: hypothetical protein Q9187_001830 [Circinaria calcarea]